ncbi:hypothetical protein [Streptomyces sp. NPDC056255]|uniref:hypothetical protein n=1 Tax=Streptomyces sp. NPDC056255 TaxID=3345764 RepID=UPI0035D5D096
MGDVGTYLAAVYLADCSTVSADGSVEWDTVLPPGEAPLTERIAAMNAKSVDLLGGDGHARPGDFVAERGETFLRITQGLAPDIPVSVPWYGQEVTITSATLTGPMGSESLVHGLDIARGAGPLWAIGPDEARLLLGQSMPTMMASATFLLDSFRRTPIWKVIARGGIRAGGRRPWPATRLGELVATPDLVAPP